MAGPQSVWVEGPPAEPRPYGLFTAAQVVEDALPRWLMGGARHEVDYAGEAFDTGGVCLDLGTLEGSVDTSSVLSLEADGEPDGDYLVTWGDDGDDEVPEAAQTIDGLVHDYTTAGDGEYTVTVVGPRAYQATLTVTVTDGEATGPFTATVGVNKVAETGVDVVEGDGFAVRYLLQCAPLGFGDGTVSLAERARNGLRMGEQRAVERVVARALARDPRAVVLNSGQAMTAVDALALLERWSAVNYPGRPTIHATPDVVTLWDHKGVVTQRMVNGVENIVTGQGTKVVSGGGYDPLLTPTPDTDDPLPANALFAQWVYITGAVQVRRAAAIEVDPALPTGGAGGARNIESHLAERPYVVTWDSVVAAVQVTTLEAGVVP